MPTGAGRSYRPATTRDGIEVSILDAGPGLDKDKAFSEDAGQGLVGLRDRVQSLGGEFHASSRPKGGTCLTAAFEFAEANMEAPAIDA
jgi:signal transduction histidine kinase